MQHGDLREHHVTLFAIAWRHVLQPLCENDITKASVSAFTVKFIVPTPVYVSAEPLNLRSISRGFNFQQDKAA